MIACFSQETGSLYTMGNTTNTASTIKQKAISYLKPDVKTVDIAFDDKSEQLLIFGFIRNIEQSLSNTIHIPLALIDLCLKFIQEQHPNIFVLCGTAKFIDSSFLNNSDNNNENKIYCLNMEKQRKYVFNVYDIGKNEGFRDKSKIISNDARWDLDNGHLSFCRCFRLPHYIEEQYFKNRYNETYKNEAAYSVLFKCGTNGMNQYKASVIMFNEKCLNNADYSEIDGFEYKLPSLAQTGSFRTIFCKKYASLCTISSHGSVHQLQFLNEFGWQTLPKSNFSKSQCTNPMIETSENELCVLSNVGVETYNFETSKWTKIGNGFLSVFNSSNASVRSSSLMHSGAYYDDSSNVVFVGGGLEECKQRYFNLHKAKWCNLPDTVFGHKYFPILHMNPNEPFIVYCGGNSNLDFGVVEFYDMRIKAKNWMIAQPNKQFQTYFKETSSHNNARIRHINI